jgi:hypothetical protein
MMPDMPITWEPVPGWRHSWQPRGRFIRHVDKAKVRQMIDDAIKASTAASARRTLTEGK